MLIWVWVAVVVIGLVILGASVVSVMGRLSGLQRAAVKLQRRQVEALQLREDAAVLERSVLKVQERAELVQRQLVIIQAGLGRQEGSHGGHFR